jgi:predicted DsbA family dithiol-disulfide isomerase
VYGEKLPRRREYLARKFGKEQAEAKWKAVEDLAQKAGLRLWAFSAGGLSAMSNVRFSAEDGIVAQSTLAHRLSVKAYKVGGQEMQGKFNDIVFEAVFAECKDISNVEFLADAAEKVGLMNKTEVWSLFKPNNQSP